MRLTTARWRAHSSERLGPVPPPPARRAPQMGLKTFLWELHTRMPKECCRPKPAPEPQVEHIPRQERNKKKNPRVPQTCWKNGFIQTCWT